MSGPRSELEKPDRILLMTTGSRGDIQPYIALARGLQFAGYAVNVLTNANHRKLLEESSLAHTSHLPDSEVALRENKEAMEAMQAGSTTVFLKFLQESADEHAVEHHTAWKEVMDTFKPDLVISGSLVDFWGFGGLFAYNVPTLFVQLFYMPPNPKRMALGLPNLPLGLNGWFVRKFFFGSGWSMMKTLSKRGAGILGFKLDDLITNKFIVDDAADPTVAPRLLILPHSWAQVVHPGIKPSVRCMGLMSLNAEYQEALASGSNGVPSSFGGASEMDRVKEFLATGDKPIYMGWGSMTCKSPEYMVQLVAKALEISRCRAIVLGGWANLSLEVLKRCTKDESVLKYMEQNALFVQAAPHEWLFPQCVCTVQHGGAGTMSCSLRAGVPLVITPVFLDQFDNSYLVNQLGVGVGFDKQFQKITAKQLATAITHCATSKAIHAKAAEVGAELRGQDGVRAVVEFVGQFWTEEVRTGRQHRRVQEVLEQTATPKKCLPCLCKPAAPSR